MEHQDNIFKSAKLNVLLNSVMSHSNERPNTTNQMAKLTLSKLTELYNQKYGIAFNVNNK
jgi:hypothetical protein